MRARRGLIGGRTPRDHELCSGPGKLTQALAISLADNEADLATGAVRITSRAPGVTPPQLVIGTRIGITRGVELPWRFCLAASRHVSRPRPQLALAGADGGGAASRRD
jgi:DNA-3-methyladenine glycosylase